MLTQMDRTTILQGLPTNSMPDALSQNPSPPSVETMQNQLIGFRNKGNVLRMIDEEINTMSEDSDNSSDNTSRRAVITEQLKEIFGQDEYEYYELSTFNTLSLHHNLNYSYNERDDRFRLRCSPSFHGKRETSSVRLKKPMTIDGSNYEYGDCLLFFSMGLRQLVVLKMMRKIIDFGHDNNMAEFIFLRSREIFEEISSTFTLLLGKDTECRIRIVDVSEIERQEQLCNVGGGIVIVNHLCWSNIF